jgi:uncharacterized repeat protein (TIGR01451 family)
VIPEEADLMSKSTLFWRLISLTGLMLVVVLHALPAGAAPPEEPLMGITPTATNTPTSAPVDTPTPTSVPADTPTPTPVRRPPEVDPVITKVGGPAVALPGDEVTFTIEVTNRGQAAAVDVVVTDDVPAYLEILGVTTTQGTAYAQGQKVVVEVGTVGQDFVVRIVIRTRVRPDTPAPVEMENVAVLRSPNAGELWTSPVIIRVPALMPETGYSTTFWAILVMAGALLIALGIVWRERARSSEHLAVE